MSAATGDALPAERHVNLVDLVRGDVQGQIFVIGRIPAERPAVDVDGQRVIRTVDAERQFQAGCFRRTGARQGVERGDGGITRRTRADRDVSVAVHTHGIGTRAFDRRGEGMSRFAAVFERRALDHDGSSDKVGFAAQAQVDARIAASHGNRRHRSG